MSDVSMHDISQQSIRGFRYLLMIPDVEGIEGHKNNDGDMDRASMRQKWGIRSHPLASLGVIRRHLALLSSKN